jgi:hypothetical protein
MFVNSQKINDHSSSALYMGMDKIRVSGSALTVKAQVQFQANPFAIYGGQSDIDRFFSESFGFFPHHYYSTSALYSFTHLLMTIYNPFNYRHH